MQPVFTGSSRRTRNVNLSGQRPNNPFQSAWAPPSSGFGASEAIQRAQEERRQRKEFKEKQDAVKVIRRVWYGHQSRKRVRHGLQHDLDQFLPNQKDARQQLLGSLVAINRLFTPCRANVDRLERVVGYLEAYMSIDIDNDSSSTARMDIDAASSGELPRGRNIFLDPLNVARPVRFLQVVVQALYWVVQQKEISSSDVHTLLPTLVRLVQGFPRHALPYLPAYYAILARLDATLGTTDPRLEQYVRLALVAPFQATQDASMLGIGPFASSQSVQAQPEEYELLRRHVARSFVSSYLYYSAILPINRSLDLQQIDVTRVLSVLQSEDIQGSQNIHTTSRSSIWLFVHVIELTNRLDEHALRRDSLEAILRVLSRAAPHIKTYLSRKQPHTASRSSQSGSNGSVKLQYIQSCLNSLTSKEALSRLVLDIDETSDISVIATFANIIKLLLYCNIASPDDVRMCLYLSDIETSAHEAIPFFIFLRNYARKSTLWQQVVADDAKAVPILVEYFQSGGQNSETVHDWPVLLLFLDMYTFILRLTNDDEFFRVVDISRNEFDPSAFSTATPASSRLVQCNLEFEDVFSLSLLLRNLAFSLFYDVTGLRDGSLLETNTSSTLSFHHDQLTGFIMAPLTLLHERDARRPFLPADHWLMTHRLNVAKRVRDVVKGQVEERKAKEAENEDETANTMSGAAGVEDEDRTEEVGFESDLSEEEEQELVMLGARPMSAGNNRDTLSTPSRHQAPRSKRVSISSHFVLAPPSTHSNARTFRQTFTAPPSTKPTAIPTTRQSDKLMLNVIDNIPFVIPFEVRVSIFRRHIELDKIMRYQPVDLAEWSRIASDDDIEVNSHAFARQLVTIPRNDIMEGARALQTIRPYLKDTIQFRFLDQFGNVEAGIDGGGVTKEFITSFIDVVFHEKDYFSAGRNGQCFPNTRGLDWAIATGNEELQQSVLQDFELIGLVLGKILYDGILVDVPFAGFFLLKWALGQNTMSGGYRANINDLRDMDEELYEGLLRLKNEPNIESLGLDFTIVDEARPPNDPDHAILHRTKPLIKNGASMSVTSDNRLLYISYVAQHRLFRQPAMVTQAFLRGLWDVIDPTWLSLFSQNELQRLVSGDLAPIDLDDLRAHTEYSGVYDDHHPNIEDFWTVMREFDDGLRRKVIRFVTSAPHAPLLGFAHLRPRFCIRDSGQVDRLPSASTCVNLLKLPNYRSLSKLRDRLTYAVTSDAGFDLS